MKISCHNFRMEALHEIYNYMENKMKLSKSLFVTCLMLASSITIAQQSVANIPITVKLQAGNIFIAQCVTNADGEFTFDFQEGLPAPASGTFIFEMPLASALPGGSILSNAKSVRTTQTLTVKFTAKTPRPFVYILKWTQLKTEKKGHFAVSGRNTA